MPLLINSLSELAGVALAVERGAIRRLEALADEMARHRNQAVAVLLRRLAADERAHEARIAAWSAGASAVPIPRRDFAWVEALSPEEIGAAGGVHLMTPYRALELAVRGEQRAFALYSEIAALTPSAAVRRRAEALAKEELEHVVMLRLERCRAYRIEHGSQGIEDAPVTSLAALFEVARRIETEARIEAERTAARLDKGGHRRAAALFARLAAQAGDTLAGMSPGIEPARIPPRASQPADPYELLRAALRQSERAFERYTAIAEAAKDEALMRAAQALAERAVARLALISTALSETA